MSQQSLKTVLRLSHNYTVDSVGYSTYIFTCLSKKISPKKLLEENSKKKKKRKTIAQRTLALFLFTSADWIGSIFLPRHLICSYCMNNETRDDQEPFRSWWLGLQTTCSHNLGPLYLIIDLP